MGFLELAKERFSVRKFKDLPIEEEKWERILEAGRVAPTAANLQPQRIYVLKTAAAVQKIASVCECIFDAPAVVVVAYDKETVWKNPLQKGYDSGEIDSSIVATHIMMEAWDQGIASCWVRYFNADKVAEALSMPKGQVPVVILPMGYAAEGAEPTANHTNKKPAEETIIEM